jgi:hypothetical protein
VRACVAAVFVLLIACVPSASAATYDIQTRTGDSIQVTPQHSQNGRIHKANPASSCASPKAVPAIDDANKLFYSASFRNFSNIDEPACVTVTYSTTVAACQNNIFAVTYMAPGYGSGRPELRYLGDSGQSPTNSNPISYSVTAQGNQFFDTAVSTSQENTGCTNFAINWKTDSPWATSRPVVSGHPIVREKLTSTQGAWLGNPTLTQQWQRCAPDGSACEDIAGETGTTYTPTYDDVGKTVLMRVTANDGAHSSSSSSAARLVGIPLASYVSRSLAAGGNTQQDLLALNGKPSVCGAQKPTPITSAGTGPHLYDVFPQQSSAETPICVVASVVSTEECAPNPGLVSTAYLPSFQPGTSLQENYLADAGTVASTGFSIAYAFDVPPGSVFEVVVAAADASSSCPGYELFLGSTSPYPFGSPGVNGFTSVGQPLYLADGNWTGEPSFARQWIRCDAEGANCEDVGGATGRTFVLTAADVGHRLKARVSATLGGTTVATSNLSDVIGPKLFNGITLFPRTVRVTRKGVAALKLKCPAAALVSCAGAETILLGKTRKLGSMAFTIAPGKTAKVKVKLKRKARKLLARKRKLTTRQVVVSHDSRNLPVTTRGKLTLKAPKRKPTRS